MIKPHMHAALAAPTPKVRRGQTYAKSFHTCGILAHIALAFALTTPVRFVCATEVQVLDAVVVNPNRHAQPSILRNEVITTESFSSRDIEKSGAVSLIEAVDKRPGISVQTECSKCSARNILLNNLPGRYTTLLIDGIPIFSSVSSAYGLDSVSLGGIERIDVSRGAGTSLIAPEALAGAVNIVSRRPTENEFVANQQIGNFGQRVTEVFAARAGDYGALTVNYNHNQHNAVDGNDSKISDYSSPRTMGSESRAPPLKNDDWRSPIFGRS